MTVAAGTVTYFPTKVEIEQEYWQSLSYLPSTAQAGSDKIKATVYDDKTQAMPKLGRSRYADATDARKACIPPKQGQSECNFITTLSTRVL